MSSSPSRPPSPNTLIRQNRALRPGAPAPSTVVSLSTSADSLLGANKTTRPKQNDSIWEIPEDEMTEKEVAMPVPSKVKAAPKPRPKKVTAVKDDNGASEAPLKKPRKSRAKKTDEGNSGPIAEPALKQKAVRKPRVKKSDAEGQTKIPKGKITKSSTGSISKNDGKAGDTFSAHFAKFTNSEDYIDIDDITLDKGLNLQEAAKRRADWTPPRATGKDFSFGGALGGVVDLDTPPKGLTDLLGSFGYSKSERPSASMQELGIFTARKRKLIELVKTNAIPASPHVAPTTKAAKKRPTTITERATAAYARGNDDDMEPTPLLQYLSHKDSGLGTGTKPRARSPTKKPKKGKNAPPPADLLNPQAAHEQASRQEFVFGTSSQLAQDEDPAFLRDLQQAIQLSNRSEDPFSEELPPTRNATTSGKRKSPKKRPSLWEAALGIEAEGATEVEILDLISSSQVERELQFDRAASIAPQTIDTLEASSQPDLAVPISLADKPFVPKEPLSQHTNPDTSKPISSTAGEQCPNFESYSTAELAKELASYKFKPIKKREQMISLLEKCWEGKQRAALGSLGVNTVIDKAADKATSPQRMQKPSQIPPALPTKPGGRPRKVSGATPPSPKRVPKPTTGRPQSPHHSERLTSDIETPALYRQSPSKKVKRRKPLPEEISDSDTPLTPSPPRRREPRTHSPPKLVLVEDDNADVASPPLSPNSTEQELFEHITKAVTTATRGTPQAPSWYEKMLMYDPIVLEDLARWLNTEGLDGAGYDGEAKGEQVKAWCRARSVCCLWKISSRKGGGVKKLGREG
ncbi:5'-flap endonuclease [Pseudogymnoascus australis]